MNKNKIISHLLTRNFLVSPDFLDNFNNDYGIIDLLNSKIKSKDKPIILDKNILFVLKKGNVCDLNWSEFEKSKSMFEKGKDDKIYKTFLDMLLYNISDIKKEVINHIIKEVKQPEKEVIIDNEETNSSVIVLKSYKEDYSKKREVQDFVQYFKKRYESLKNMLQTRQELCNVISINKILNRKENDNVGLIGIIVSKNITKKGNIILELEDPTGSIKVIITKNKKNVFDLGNELVLDEVVGIVGNSGDKVVFCNNIIFPEVPINKELKKISDDVSAVFIGDMHIGSTMFYEKEFMDFIEWLNSNKDLTKSIKYLFIVGDIIDGIGVFPNQDKELKIKDINLQFKLCAELLSQIRDDISIIICPGNHDAMRISEPQPAFDNTYAEPLCNLKNVTRVTNPSLVNIHSSNDFPGFDVLMYHGYSFQYYGDNVDSIRLEGGTDRADLIMKFLLKKRHLAPTHTSTLYIPDNKEDPLVIEKVPDFFVTGHLHRTSILNYNNITLMSCSCWQEQTPFMEKMGVHPDPCKAILVNLKTREVKTVDFKK
jgi:DNA polymerase II small subunit